MIANQRENERRRRRAVWGMSQDSFDVVVVVTVETRTMATAKGTTGEHGLCWREAEECTQNGPSA